jgi:hypothetical protein
MLDPDGKKVGEETVGDDFIERFISLWDHWTTIRRTREEAIACLNPYVASKRENTYLHLVSELLQSLPDEIDDVDEMMETWKGDYNEMFESIQNHIREIERARDQLADNTAMVTDNDDLSTSPSLFIEDIANPPHTSPTTIPPQDAIIQGPVVDIIIDHELELHNKMEVHVQNRKEADQEKDTSGRERAGGSNKLFRVTRQASKRALEN